MFPRCTSAITTHNRIQNIFQGPILGGTFGLVVKKKALRSTGLETELWGLFISATVGCQFDK